MNSQQIILRLNTRGIPIKNHIQRRSCGYQKTYLTLYFKKSIQYGETEAKYVSIR